MPKSPEEVFTIKTSVVNINMYVERQELEEALLNKIQGELNIIIYGESGSGKTWLYKKVLNENELPYETVNLAQVSLNGGIIKSIKKKLERYKTNYIKEIKTKVDNNLTLIPKLLNAGISVEVIEGLYEKDPVEGIFELLYLSHGSKNKRSYLVLENLETIFTDTEAMKELSSLLMLQDDEDYEHYNVRILLVGVPNGIREYFSKFSAGENIKNRLTEIPEVARLTEAQCKLLIEKGFLNELKISFVDNTFDTLKKHIIWVADRIPQRTQEYCLILAKLIEENDGFELKLLEEADKKWLSGNLKSDYSIVESRMNSKDTKEQRRNQILFALSKNTQAEFKASHIESLVRETFNVDESTALDISGILSQLCSEQEVKSSGNILKPILRKSPSGDAYLFSDPKYLMCLRMMLNLNDEGRIDKIDIIL